MGHQKVSWITPIVERGRDVRSFSLLWPERDREFTASATSMKAGGRSWFTWRDGLDDPPTHFSAIDHSKSPVIEKLANLGPSQFDTREDIEQKLKKWELYSQTGCFTTSHCTGDEHPLQHDKQTLFVNASYCGYGLFPVQRPWLVDIELPKASNRGIHIHT